MNLFFRRLALFLLLLTNRMAYGQLCEGSLGEPVVNITFGSGQNPGQMLDSALTNYIFVPYSCPNDGSYTVANSSSLCFGDTWITLADDHTPNDTNGYMMLVNASFDPGDFYLKEVQGLCENTTYEFAAWIMNILRPSACMLAGITPDVTFSIETTAGTILQKYNTGSIPADNFANWKQYGLFFKTPPGINSVIIRMRNNAPGGCGNDLALDDITFRPCGALVDVSINNGSTIEYVCEGDSPTFSFNSNVTPPGPNTMYQWEVSKDEGVSWAEIPGATDATFTRQPVFGLGVYQYRLAVAQGDFILIPSCSKVMSKVLTIKQVPLPAVDAASNSPVCEGMALVLRANDASLYSWTGPQNFSSNQPSPSISNVAIANAGKYFVNITSAEGCVNNDSVSVSILAGPTVDAGRDTSICEGQSIRLKGSVSAPSFQWKPEQSLSNNKITDPIANPLQDTYYILTADNGTCPKSDSVLVKVFQKPVADAGADKVIIKGDTTTLNGTSNISEASVLWGPPGSLSSYNTLTSVASPLATTTYILSLTSNYGCGSSADSVVVKVYPDVFIPNAFTPNGDGLNDTWKIEALEAFPQAEIKVYNRFGQNIFTGSGQGTSWDGRFQNKLQQPGAYPYIIDLKSGAPVRKGVLFLLL